MEKPTYPQIVRMTPAEIRAIRKGLGPGVTQEKFGRYFPVSMDTVRSWENGRSNPYGPCNIRLQVLKAYVDYLQADRKEAEARFLAGRPC